jgi:hypothetical protein
MRARSYQHVRFDFFRPLDWRRLEAEKLAARQGRSRPVDDPAVAALAAFAAAERRSRRRRDEPPEWARLREARGLWSDGGLLRAEVEARILAGQTDVEIAIEYGLVPEAVRWFEAAFFCVRDRLRARDWITGRVIGRHFPPADPAPVWKLYAYWGGPLALDLVQSVMAGRPLPVVGRPAVNDDSAYADATVRFLVSLHVSALRATSAAEWLGLIEAYAAAQREDRRRGGTSLLNADVRVAHETMRLAVLASGRGPTRRPGRPATAQGDPAAPASMKRQEAPTRLAS